MSTYAIGDIQGCYDDLQRLLDLIHYDPAQDTLWCTGDLVNRGPDSLDVLRFFKRLGTDAKVVLGNHDIHLLAVAYGYQHYLKPKDTLLPILIAPDRDELIDWLRHRPLMHHDETLGFTMLHAGLPPQWDLAAAQAYAGEVEAVLRSELCGEFLGHIYGNKPRKWSEELKGWERLRFITNCFTRLRYCTAKGKLSLKKKHAPIYELCSEKRDYPWFLNPERKSAALQIICGHWSTLGLHQADGVYALDTGCLWGGALTAFRLDDTEVFSLPCQGICQPSLSF